MKDAAVDAVAGGIRQPGAVGAAGDSPRVEVLWTSFQRRMRRQSQQIYG